MNTNHVGQSFMWSMNACPQSECVCACDLKDYKHPRDTRIKPFKARVIKKRTEKRIDDFKTFIICFIQK